MLNLKNESLEWSLKHINKYSDSYIFPKPFEFEAINEYWDEVKDYLRKLDVYNDGVRPYRSEITPKSQTGFRICTQLDPLDSIIYNAIIYEISSDIEKARIDKHENIVFSFRLDPNEEGDLFDKNYNWNSFNKEAERLCKDEKYKCVVITDIADFYPSVYLHNIETHLKECVIKSGKTIHANTLINMIKAMHINQTHKGLPIGPQFSRPIAELMLNQIDQILLENDIRFIRYVDDYRIFCETEADGYKLLSFLAQNCYDLLNLKLNEHKTRIMTKEEFISDYIDRFSDDEKNRILEKFYELCDKLGINTDTYIDSDFDKLSNEDKSELGSLNIKELLMEELGKDTQNLGFIKFLLSNLARFDNTEIAEYILEDKLYNIFPILRSFIDYLERVRSFSEEQKHKIGKIVLEHIDNHYISVLEFNRAWLLHLFTKNDEWNNKGYFNKLVRKYDDGLTKRELLLCLGRSKNHQYFRQNKMVNIEQFDPWVRRAFIVGISCLPQDERRPWYKARKQTHRGFLDSIVEKWAENYPV